MNNNLRYIGSLTLMALISGFSTRSYAIGDEPFKPFSRLQRAIEAKTLKSEVGVPQALVPIYRDTWKLTHLSEEALYLDAVARSVLESDEAELKLLSFIEEHPHSAYLPYAETKLGEWYYLKGQYNAAASWFRKVNTSLLPEQMSASTEYYYAFSLLKTGQDAEALRKFEPLVFSHDFGTDSKFYTGYLLLKRGDLERAIPHLKGLFGHATYGPYARAYASAGLLSARNYSETVSLAEETLSTGITLPNEVRWSLLRSAGLAHSSLGSREKAVARLTEYVKESPAPGRVELLMLGKNLQELNRATTAIQYLEQIPTGEDDFMSQLAFYYLGLSHLTAKNTNSARSAFYQASRIGSYPPLTEASAYNAALTTYAQTPGRVGDGLEALVSFIKRYPKSEYFNQSVGHIEDALLGEPDNSKALNAINAINPLPKNLNRVREKLRLGQANRSLAGGNTAEATRQYNDIISRNADPSSVAEAYLWKGEAAYREGNYNEAVQSTKLYLDKRPESLTLNPNAFFTLGYAYFNLKKYAESGSYLRQYLASAPSASSDAQTGVYNRLGDIALQTRDYVGAQEFFITAEKMGGNEADYALLSRALILGLQKDYRGKIELLTTFGHKYKSSERAPEALFEKGRTLSLMGDQSGARSTFEQFFSLYPKSPIAPKAGIELALSYFNDNQLSEAAQSYEQVIRRYPGSPEAMTALQDLKSISITLNRVNEYNDILRETGLNDRLSDKELDQMTYLAAERLISEGKSIDARNALDAYISKYPNGVYIQKAYYSKALIDYNQHHYSEASETLRLLTSQRMDNTLTAEAYTLLAKTYDNMGESGRAAEVYLAKAIHATTKDQRSESLLLAVDRAEKSGSSDFLLALAGDVYHEKYQVTEEAKAKILTLATEQYAKSNQKDEALKYANQILKLSGHEHDTAPTVIIALNLYDRGQYQESKKRMEALVQRGSNDAYWLARGFILLADSYHKLGDSETARTYLESVQSSYPERGDGIIELVEKRLKELE